MVEGSWDYAFPLLVFIITDHGKCFAGPGLPICKDGSIEAIKRILNDRKATGLVDLMLLCIYTEDIVKDEIFDVMLILFDAKHIILSLDTERRCHIGLPLVEWPYPQAHLD